MISREAGILHIDRSGSIACRADKAGPEISGNIPAQAGFHSPVGIGVHIAQSPAQVSNGVELHPASGSSLQEAPFAFVDHSETRFVFDLIVPAIGALEVSHFVHKFLRFFCERFRAYDAQLDFHRVQTAVVFAMKGNPEIGPSCIRTVVFNQLLARDILGRIHVLTNGKRNIALQPRLIDERQSAYERQAPVRQPAAFCITGQIR